MLYKGILLFDTDNTENYYYYCETKNLCLKRGHGLPPALYITDTLLPTKCLLDAGLSESFKSLLK